MSRTIGCPNCPTKLKVPDDAGGRRARCPKCGGVMTVPSDAESTPSTREVEPTPPLPHTPEPPLTPPPAKPHDSPPPVRARRTDGPEGRPVPAARRRDDDEDRPVRRRQRDNGDRHDDDTARLHKGWKAVALGYRMLGLGMLFFFVGVVATVGVLVALDGVKNLENLFSGNKLSDRAVTELTIPFAVGGGFGLLSGLLSFLGLLFFMGMPKDEDGGKGKVLAVAMFILPFFGLGAISALLLPIFSGGVGSALNKPKLRKYGFGLFIWYAVGFVLVPLLVWGAHYGVMAGLGDAVVAGIVAAVVGLILGLLVFFSIWGTFAGMRRGIQSSTRERGIIGGEDPKPNEKKKSREREDDNDDRDESDNDPPPPGKRAIRTEDDDDDRPKKRKRDEDEDRPRKRR